MGGYYGSPATILKNNRNLLKKHDRNKWKSLQTSYRKTLKEKDASPELLAEIRKKFQKQRRNNIMIPLMLTFIFVTILYFGIIYYFDLQ